MTPEKRSTPPTPSSRGLGTDDGCFRRLDTEERFKSGQHFISDEIVYLPKPVDANELPISASKQEANRGGESHSLEIGLRIGIEADHHAVAVIEPIKLVSFSSGDYAYARVRRLDAPMFIRVDERGEREELPEFWPPRAMVRLKCFHLAPHRVRQVRERFMRSPLERFRFVRQHEGRAAIWLPASEPVDRERVDHVVEAGAQIGDGITSKPRPCPGRGLP